jgi:translation initiation factor IF-2
MIELEEHEVKIGSLEVLGVFFKRGKEMIFGGKVTDGKVVNGAKFKVWREDDEQVDEDGEPAPVATGKVTSLQKEKDNVSEVKEGHECGMKAKVSKKIEVGDRIDFYVIEKR